MTMWPSFFLLLLMIVVAPICTGLWVMFVCQIPDVWCSTNKPRPLSPSLSRSSAGRWGSHSLFVFVDVFREIPWFFRIPVGSCEISHIPSWVCSLLKQTLHVSSMLVPVMWAKYSPEAKLDRSTDLGLLCSLSLIRKSVIPVKLR